VLKKSIVGEAESLRKVKTGQSGNGKRDRVVDLIPQAFEGGGNQADHSRSTKETYETERRPSTFRKNEQRREKKSWHI